MQINILAIESSCDDTSISLVQNGVILSNITANQEIHIKYGGVVPESASRAHMENLLPVVKASLHKSTMRLSDLQCIAVTKGPGLLGSLIVGVSFAKGLAMGLNLPLITVNHLEAHVASLLIDRENVQYPFLCMTVSGGHTQLVIVDENLNMKIIGQTIDDAAGEAFDKIGKLLGLPYPAGPHIDKLSELGEATFSFPISKMSEYNYSFSGLKTSVLYFLKKELEKNPEFISQNLNNLCRSVQDTIIESLLRKAKMAMIDHGIKTIGIAGGVSANRGLRSKLTNMADENQWNVLIPKFEYCTDNAAMIGFLAHKKYQKNQFANIDFTPLARYPIGAQ
ncbi:MAG: tRNA (adenosine(37)-N6)-threonylcarbamoyltransferase complex transferase subunit TsaD [Saprospiraceae bacterium]|nr:tRNA (adenosine(37)-N6)-threonylcarbamoyltransferase complex transferase subunit TsaD [Saprospiraceae bacterium]MBK7466666.1 tRNA (adenosine(37)-N6)-threonylcarbamoyltransferase complex transferase subunit TsaD [Saprospiraceae bacterium]MBK9995444.1 tRNA (adenosine(37)-N6)-threonylcarbamoyltransferase complex transferase subunit TsaD [Saprospiraceae bacterium]